MSEKKVSRFKSDLLEFQFWLQDRWDDFTSPIAHHWWRFQEWRRKRNPELVELDTFRRIVELEAKIEKYPKAVPLLTELMNAYKVTGQEEKRLKVMRKLRDIEPPEPKTTNAVEGDFISEEDEKLYQKALSLVRNGVRAKAVVMNRYLCVGYNKAAQICDLLVSRGVVDFDTRQFVRWSNSEESAPKGDNC